MRVQVWLAAGLLALGSALPAAAQTASTSVQSEITVYARTQEKTKDRIFLVGEVEIRYKELRLFADRVELDTRTKDCVATGNVTVQLPDESVTAEEVFVNLETKLGKMVKADGIVQPTIFYHAASIERKPGNLYELLKAQVTSCAQPVPRWRFDSTRANFKKDDYIEMWNAVFRIKRVPVFYMPYMRYPVGRDRATGFLIPRIGWSGNKGFNYEQSFYWAIARNMDATFNLDYYAARGVGGALNFRYMFHGGTGGEANLYGFTFKRDASGTKKENAYIVRWNHNQPLPLGFSLVANVDLQSSYDFLREFDNNFRRAVVSNRSSQVYLQRSWSYFNLSARVSKSETYFGQTGFNFTIVSKSTPQISFSMFKVKLFGPVYASFASGYSNQEYGVLEANRTGTQRKAGSLTFAPTVSVPFTLIPWLTVNTAVTGNFIYYPKSYEPGTTRVGTDPLFTKNAMITAEVAGPVFSKVYRNAQGDPIFKHSIEPYANYRLDTPIPESKRIITTYAYFFRYHQIEYGITNRFYVKDANDQPRELVQVGVGETFYIAPEEGPLSLFRVNGKVPRFSEIQGTLRFYPAANYSLDTSAEYNPYYGNLSSLRVSANAGSREKGLFLSLRWFRSTSSWYRDAFSAIFGKRHQVGVTAGFKIPKIPIDLLADVDYNAKERKFLYLGGSAIYHYQCLDFEFEMKVFYFRTKPETQFKFSLGLGNIGKTTDFLGGFGF
ncbi:MAG TPA: LPS assembly protein LptD [Acidobacteriota bacterium]|nr:LPS assembly protein LptD [Acidobacteriota bacterium]